MTTARLLRLLSVLALSGVGLCGHAQVREADDDWGVSKNSFKRPRSKAEIDSVIRAYVASKGYTRYFSDFYQSPDGEFWRLIGNRHISDDDRRIVLFQPCPFIDSVTFRRLGYGYFADKSGVYCDTREDDEKMKPIKGASIATFHPVGCSCLAVDDQHVYWFGVLLPELNPAEVKVYTLMGRCSDRSQVHTFFVGRTAVYQETKLLPNKTARNFKVPKGWELVYSKGQLLAKARRQ